MAAPFLKLRVVSRLCFVLGLHLQPLMI